MNGGHDLGGMHGLGPINPEPEQNEEVFHYEWEKKVGSKSKPFYVRRSDRQQMIFAGIWQFSGDSEHRIPTCAIITVPASKQISGIHNRMPLIIDPSDWAGWLGEGQGFKAAKLMKTPSDIELEVVNVINEIKSTNAPV